MSATRIEWCDRTVNPVVGCSKCSPGCDNCYAERIAAMRVKHPNPKISGKYAGVVDERGRWTGKLSGLDLSCFDRLPKKPARIFVGSMTDLFHPGLSDGDGQGWRAMLNIFHMYPQHTFITLTKRPDRMERDIDWLIAQDGDLPENYWPGVTIWDQQSADEFIPILLRIPAAKRIVSVEPMLGPVDLTALDPMQMHVPEMREINALTGVIRQEIQSETSWHTVRGNRLDWIICGGETGPGARPMHPEWVRSLRDQCVEAGAPFFFKGWGEWAYIHPATCSKDEIVDARKELIFSPDGKITSGISSYGPDAVIVQRVGKRRSGRSLDEQGPRMERGAVMTFLDAREALHSGKRIRHESMPDGNWIMVYRRGFGDDMLIMVNAEENLSGDHVDFVALFWATLTQYDDGWEIKDGGSS